jgi:cytoskeletal protein RodZ
MQIYGNGSSQYNLNWYQDINQTLLPSAWMLTIPMIVYRILMLLWALWLAFSIIQWSKWFWQCFSTHGYWRSVNWKKKPKTASPTKTLPGQPTAEKKYIEGTTSEDKSSH